MAEQPLPARFNLVMFRTRRPQDYRCTGCGRKLGELIFAPGQYVGIKCPRCGRRNVSDVALNSTSAPVLVEFLDHLNGNTPEAVVEAVLRFVARNGLAEQARGPIDKTGPDVLR